MPVTHGTNTEEERKADFEMEIEPLNEGEEVRGQPAHSGLDGEPQEVPRLVSFELPKRLRGRLFSLRNNSMNKAATNLAGATGRSFNYEEIYDADKYGEEAFPDARVWKVYNAEAQLFDFERIEAWRDAVDVLLVFIGLFAAVVSTFLIETSKSLQPDYAQLAVIVSFEILRSLNNTVLPHSTFSPNLLDPRFGEATKDNTVVNALWYTSLTLSLSTALLAMLVKQWLHQFMISTSGTARERARNRQFRYAGLEKYRVPQIIDLLPTLLHIALGLFLVGLSIYLKQLDHVMFGLVASFAAIPYTFYLISVTIPLFDAQCPYKSPPSFYIYPLQRWLSSAVRSALYWMVQVGSRVRRLARNPPAQPKKEGAKLVVITEEEVQSPTLGEAEKHAVSQMGHQLDVDGIVYLCRTSANTSVRNIALEAFSGLPPLDADVRAVEPIIYSDLLAAIRACRAADEQWDNFASPGVERRHDRLIRALCTFPEAEVRAPYTLDMQHPYPGETDPRRIFGRWLFPWFEKEWEEYYHFAALFTFSSQQAFPLPIWAALIRLATRHQPKHPVIRVVLASTLHLSPDMVDMGAVSLPRAMQNPYVRSIGMEYLGISDVKREGILSVSLSLVTPLLTEENTPGLAEIGHNVLHVSSSDPDPSSPTSHLLTTILPPLFRSLASQLEDGSEEQLDTKMLSTILTDFFMSPHIHDVSRETLFTAIRMWSAPYPQAVQDISTPYIICLAIKQFRRFHHPKEEDVEWMRRASIYLSAIFETCIDDTSPELCEAVCSTIRELDMLSIDLETQDTMSTRHLFWSESMCETIVQKTYNYSKTRRVGDWFDEWEAYLHAPKRLAFLSSKLIPRYQDALLTLCQLWPEHTSWPGVLNVLLSLFENRKYLDTMVQTRGNKIQQAQDCLSDGLDGMKKVLVGHHPILSERKFDIPRIHWEDSLAPRSSVIDPTTDFRLQSPHSIGFASNLDRQEDYVEPPPTPTNPLPGASLPDEHLMQDSAEFDMNLASAQVFLTHANNGPFDLSSPVASGMDPIRLAHREPFAAATAIGAIFQPHESPLEEPKDVQYVSLDLAEPVPGVSSPYGQEQTQSSVHMERQSVDSRAEQGHLNVAG